jgi:hypothetical protein
LFLSAILVPAGGVLAGRLTAAVVRAHSAASLPGMHIGNLRSGIPHLLPDELFTTHNDTIWLAVFSASERLL